MPPAPRQVSPAIREDIERVLALGLAKRPADRFQTAAQLAAALAAARKNRLSDELRRRADILQTEQPWSPVGGRAFGA